MKPDQFKKNMLIGTVAFVVIAAALVFGIFTEYKQLRSVQAEIAVAEGQIADLEKRLHRLQLLKQQEQELVRQLAMAREMLPASLNEQDLIDEIQAAALPAGCVVTEFRFGDPVAGDQYTEVPFNLALEGQFASLMGFLDTLERDPKIYRIDDFSVQSSRGEGIVRVDLEMSSFYMD